MTIQNIFKRFLNAGLRAYSIPTLPDHILKIQSYPIIRILRFLGGISLLMILSKSYLNYHSYFLYFFYFFALIFTKHMLSIFKSDIFEIKNSPVDRFATLGARALWCLKGACETAQPVGVTLGLMISTDQILQAANREPIFTPFLAGLLNQILPETGNPSTSKIIENSFAKIKQNNSELEALKYSKELINLPGGLSAEDNTEFNQIISDHQKELMNNNIEIKNKMIEDLKKKK